MAKKSQITRIVANQLGGLRGDLEARIQTEVTRLFSEFANQCPNAERLEKIIGIRNNLIRVTSNFQKKTNKFANITRQLIAPIRIARIVITLLKKDPTPVAIGVPPGPAGGLIFAKSTGSLTSKADRLERIHEILVALESSITVIDGLVSSTNNTLRNTIQLFESVDINVNKCLSELDSDTLANLVKKIQPLENVGSEGTPSAEYLYTGSNGKNYTLAIIQETQTKGSIPRRIAVAKDNLGIIVLRGQPSFSSDTKVLLDELKFRIDNQLP